MSSLGVNASVGARRAPMAAIFYIVRVSSVLLPVVQVLGVLRGGWGCWAGALCIFGLYSLAEFALFALGLGVRDTSGDEFDPSALPALALNGQLPLYLFALGHFVATPAVFILLARSNPTPFELTGAVLSMSLITGSVGALTAHEFMHSRRRWKQWVGTAIAASVSYGHFRIAHLYGHHRRVGLHDDWNTAREGESSYAYVARAYTSSVIGAWRIEAQRLRRKGKSPFSPRNFMVSYGLFQVPFWWLIVHALGTRGALAYLCFNALTVGLSEVINYVTHYGITRHVGADGVPETVRDEHAWECSHRVSNWFALNFGKHSLHHRAPSRPYNELRLTFHGPCLPYGLPAMTLLALVPPAYLRVMAAHLRKSTAGRSAMARTSNA